MRFQLGRPPALGFAGPKGRSQGGFWGVFRRDALGLSPQPPWTVSRFCGAATGAVPHPIAGDGGGFRAAADQAASPWASNLSCTSRCQVRVYSPRGGGFVIGPPLRGAFRRCGERRESFLDSGRPKSGSRVCGPPQATLRRRYTPARLASRQGQAASAACLISGWGQPACAAADRRLGGACVAADVAKPHGENPGRSLSKSAYR